MVEQENTNSGQLNRYNLTLTDSLEKQFDRDNRYKVAKVLTEAWVWLEKEGFIECKPDTQGEWVFITRKGKKLSDSTNFKTYLLCGRITGRRYFVCKTVIY